MKVYQISEELICPYCQTKLKVKYFKNDKRHNNWGVCVCMCDEYPIIEGVFYLVRDDGFLNKKIVKLLQEKKFYQALEIILKDTQRIHKLILKLFYHLKKPGLQVNLNIIFSILKLFSKNNDFRNWISYNQHRTGNDSHLLTKKLLKNNILVNAILIDIGCGFGIIAKEMLSKSDNIKYIGIDKCFSTLLTNRYFSSYNNILICSNTDFPIPLKNNLANYILVLDTITNIHNPKKLIAECYRVLKKRGTVYIINVYNMTKVTYLWGYGINILILKSWMEKYFKKIIFIKNHLSPSGGVVMIQEITKNIFSYSCHATK